MTKYLIGNWKANLDLAEVDAFVAEWQKVAPNLGEEKKMALAVPAIFYTYLY